jgi:integrase
MQINSYKVGSKTFYSCRFWYYKNGEKKSKYKKGFDKKKTATDWGNDEKKRLEGLKAGSDSVKVKEFLDQWIKTKQKLAPTTYRGYKVNIAHINEHIGNMKLSEVRLINIQNMVDELRSKKKLKHMTVKYICRTLHAAFQYAIDNDMINKNPCNKVEITEDDEKFQVIVYSADQLRALLDALRSQEHYLYPLVLMAAMRGLRRGECLGLRWSDIDFENGIVHVINNYVVVDKVGYHRKVKTKESERKSDISGYICEELKAYKERKHKGGRILTYMCEQEDGTLPEPSHISRGLKTFQNANGLPECRFHDLRHTFAVLQLEHGTDIDTLRRLLGHSKIGMTSDTYLHPNKTLIKKASEALDNTIFMKCHTNVTTDDEKKEGSK